MENVFKDLVISEEIANKAVVWFVRLRAQDARASERNTFFNCLKEDSLHQHAFVEIVKIWEGLSVINRIDGAECFPRIREYIQNSKSVACQ
ncbi:MAG: ferric-dicitrate binding protein FerR (iron transport regulator) [Candidatus Azotimanducaceae bacterium]|jgi:ferric-dicitrate binding protein FerR (iron transport regulator)